MVSTPSTVLPPMRMAQVSGNPAVLTAAGKAATSLAAATQVFNPGRKADPSTDRNSIAKPWQIEAYRHVNLCGEARYSATLFAALASRAEIGVSEPNALVTKATWVTSGPEVDAFAEVAPTVRERSKLIRDYMLHRVIAGECYLIARNRVDTDPGYIPPPVVDGETFASWKAYNQATVDTVDMMDPDFDPADYENPNTPLWEIVGVTELRKTGDTWQVRHDNGNYLDLTSDDPVIRMWTPDPENRREAWSPFRSMIPTLREIEWLTMHIFTQVKSRLMAAGVWFLPNNLTFPPPPADSVEGGEAAIALMNEAERFMLSLASAGISLLNSEEVSFPSIVMADPAALAAVDQKKLIQFWSEIDDKAMTLRSDAIRRFALGMDLPPEQVIGSSGIAVTGSGGSAGSVNHWGVWANEEQTITAHIEPALDDFVGIFTVAVLRRAVENTLLVIGYDSATLRLRQDRSKESIELYDRGLLKASVAVKENGFDPQNDMMSDAEFKRWILVKIAGGSATPEQVSAALTLLNVVLPAVPSPPDDQLGRADVAADPAPQHPGSNQPPNLDDHPYEGPPRVQHDQTPAPYSADVAASEVLVLRALEKAGNRLLNDGKRGKDRDRTTPPHLAHIAASIPRTVIGQEFDFSLASAVWPDLPAAAIAERSADLARFCASLYNSGEGYTRERLIEALETA